jgi:hypothetical protein
MPDPTICEPEGIRDARAPDLRAVYASSILQANLGWLHSEDWTAAKLVEMMFTPDA